jgi:hypothetical protein
MRPERPELDADSHDQKKKELPAVVGSSFILT